MKKIAIIGAGVGGQIVANSLARSLRREIVKGEVEITVFDKSREYVLEAGLPLYVLGAFEEESLVYKKARLLDPKVKALLGDDGEVTRVDLKDRKIYTKPGKIYTYDYLVIAAGCGYDLSLVPGLEQDYHTYYEYNKAKELKELLHNFKGGTIVHLVAMLDVSIKCPIAPGKFSLVLDTYLRHVKHLAGRYKIIVATTTDHLHAQPEVNKALEERFRDHGLQYIYDFEPAQIDANEKVVVSTDGEKLKYDLLITVPPHRGPKFVAESGIGDPFSLIPADRYTLNYRKGKEHYDDVWVVGDVANFGASRSGSVAHYEAIVVSHNILNEIKGVGDRWLFYGETICPYYESLYVPAERGRAWIPIWTYGKNARPYVGNRWAWHILRVYYYNIPLTLRGLL
ncbi:MAG: FAD/NAD(P)-binding oxidoreductase [Pyrobaculum sp.]